MSGWKLVPVEPTEDMIDAACESNAVDDDLRAAYEYAEKALRAYDERSGK